MKCITCFLIPLLLFVVECNLIGQEVISVGTKKIRLTEKAKHILKGKQILFIEREQYAPDHHNTATLFQCGEINEANFAPGGAMRIYDVDSGNIRTLIETETGVVRDPELSFDGKKILFSMRKNPQDFYHLYEINVDGSGLKQLTFASGVSDIDPIYLPDGDIIFTSTRQPKYCMCNRHIMGNLFRMEADGANITQIGVSTLFEGHSSLLHDGRVLYTRWEYVDRNFGDAQGLWVVNPDGTKHAIYYGNNTASPGAVLDGRQIPNTDWVICVFSSCHERPWGALAIIDRKKGVDNADALVDIWPKEMAKYVGNGDLDTFKSSEYFYEDPYPIDENNYLVSRTIWIKRVKGKLFDAKSGIYLIGRDGTEEILLEGQESLFDPMIIAARPKPNVIPTMRNFTDKEGQFYVENVYEGTHMEGVKPGSVKYLRVVESPEKRTWTERGWSGEGEQAPGMNWHSFENKQILGEVEVEEDGSASFYVPAGKHVYFQLLDKDKKMIQSMRSGVSLMPGEINGCIGCHEDRLNAVPVRGKRSQALSQKPKQLIPWMGKEPHKFSFVEEVRPILDKYCLKCHDFDRKNREKLVLAGDKNPFFNAAYVNLYVSGAVRLIGGGPASIQQAYSWGSHVSKLSQVIENKHQGVQLSSKEKEVLYTWMDLNGVYYPIYESSFGSHWAGRCPLTDEEVELLSQLTGIDFNVLNSWKRKLQAQISFDRPEESPCLDVIRHDKEKMKQALSILHIGKKRLKATPRGDVESKITLSEKDKNQLRKYANRLLEEEKNKQSIVKGTKYYDPQ